MTASTPTVAPTDLRVESVDEVLERVERALCTRVDLGTMVRKRRTVGACTDRGTWVRIERRPLAKVKGQGWNGTECAAVLDGVAKPAWLQALSWSDAARGAMWRADETELLPGEPVGPDSVLSLPDEWWEALNVSLDALAAQHTTRVATPDTVTITQAGVTEVIKETFPDVTDTTIREWSPAHADLNWANVTAPQFCLFDWEDWGMAPRGLDAAWLWGNSLVFPDLAERVRRERRRDLESRDGQLMSLFFCTKILGRHTDPGDPRLGFARIEAERIVAELQAG
ncbi:hypothetical protein [Streptomyces sp. S.PNR 29]|uniref:hypothetical protein n=1 Tax=Streptomyces sp. S.PNR 29 TaxID=2973805 RepID=UPI0025B02CDB|nr:hypothetical protein [Streptomyces sp. S.PNR 29]MDN0193886.1 hypothetical protein [Streptomyces sp. S.PNR 29]